MRPRRGDSAILAGVTLGLKPLRIGDLRIEFPVTLAALAGYTDLPYRLACRELGAHCCATEMMLDRLLLHRGKHLRWMLARDEADRPLVGQLLGSDPETMAAAAGKLCREGFDVVDLNFACPVKKALKRRRGGHFLRAPEYAVAVTRAVLGAAERPVTLKLRRRFAEADSDDAFWRIAEAAFDAGAAAICVHARSVEAKYTGRADWGFLAEVKDRFPDRTVLGSGDVLRPDDALAMFRETGVDGVTAARGALGNPWFFRQVRRRVEGKPPGRPSVDEQRGVLLRHLRRACDVYGWRRGGKVMRRCGIKYARMHPRPVEVRAAFIEARGTEDCIAVLDEHYDRDPERVITAAKPGGRQR